MKLARFCGCLALLGTVTLLTAALSPAQDTAKADSLAAQAWAILAQNCYQCHGKDPDPKNHKAKLNLRDHAALLAADRGIVVPKKPDDSEMIKRIDSSDDAERMPFKKPALSAADRKVLRDWVAAGAPAFPPKPATGAPATAATDTDRTARKPAEKPTVSDEEKQALTASVKMILKNNCAGCHGEVKPKAGMNVLDHAVLVKDVVTPGNSDQSKLFTSLAHSEAPFMPQGRPQLPYNQIETVRKWIAAGAPGPFPPDEKVAADKIGERYILSAILKDVRQQPATKRQFVRYFSINHLLARGATRDELNLHTEAFAKAVNHLTWMPDVVKPEPIEDTKTVFRLDISELGWETRPFEIKSGADNGKTSTINLYDLVLLEYPYGVMDTDSAECQQLLSEYLQPSGEPPQVRPVPYVRADWFASVATSSPLYEDLLQLPFKLKSDRDANGRRTGKFGLEDRLNVDTKANVENFTAQRAGVTVSGVSRNNRVVERHKTQFGAYWKSFDFRTSKGAENMFRDPINFTFFGGEMIFTLPNGSMGYFVCDANGKRLEAAPTEIVVDANASDKVVRNGLACMRCHDQGVKTGFKDDINSSVQQIRFLQPGLQADVLKLYPGQKEIDRLLRQDQNRFVNAMTTLNGGKPIREPLTPVSQQFLDGALDLKTVTAELGQPNPSQVQGLFQGADLMSAGMYQLANDGAVRRDTFEEFYDRAARRFGTPLVDVDSMTRRNFDPANSTLDVEFKTNQRVFKPGEDLKLTINNKGGKEISIELIATDDTGVKVILLPPERLAAGASKEHSLKIQPGAGKSLVTLYASEKEFEAAQLLRAPGSKVGTGEDVFDRVVHKSFYKFDFDNQKRRFTLSFDPGQQVLKRTLEVETQ